MHAIFTENDSSIMYNHISVIKIMSEYCGAALILIQANSMQSDYVGKVGCIQGSKEGRTENNRQHSGKTKSNGAPRR